MTKPRELLKPLLPAKRWNLDNLIIHSFGPDAPGSQNILDYYIRSQVDHQRYHRFGVRIDNGHVSLRNSFVPGFEEMGENERYIINKIIFGEQPVTVIVGTVGAGKTTVCKFIQHKLQETIVPCPGQNSTGTGMKPLQIYVDLNELHSNVLTHSTNDKEITDYFYDYLATHVRYGISNLCNMKTEIGEIWDEALTVPPPQHLGPEFKRIVGTLRARMLDSWDEAGERVYSTIMKQRSALHQELEKDRSKFCAYLCELLSHLRRKLFAGVRWGIVLYIDNLDQLSVHAQQVIRSSLLPLLRLADIRSVVMMRVSTWRMARNDAFTFPVDSIPHSGPEPCEAIMARLRAAKRLRPENFGVRLEDPESWEKHVDTLLASLQRPNSMLSECITRLSGFSIRKAFTLAHHLLASLEYPPEQEYLREHHLKRMVIAQGPPDNYSWSERSVVDNLFQVHAAGATAPLLKIRILKALRTSSEAHPLRLGTLVTLLSTFGYESDLIRLALNELMQSHKRIVWTDSLLCFSTAEAFQAARESKVYAATVAIGYISLARDLDYLREMAMDTDVPGLVLSDEPRPGHPPSARLSLEALLRFMKWLWQTDVREMVHFFEVPHTVDDYRAHFNGTGMITSEFLSACLEQYERIIFAAQGKWANELLLELESLRTEIAYPLEKIAATTRIVKGTDGKDLILFSEDE